MSSCNQKFKNSTYAHFCTALFLPIMHLLWVWEVSAVRSREKQEAKPVSSSTSTYTCSWLTAGDLLPDPTLSGVFWKPAQSQVDESHLWLRSLSHTQVEFILVSPVIQVEPERVVVGVCGSALPFLQMCCEEGGASFVAALVGKFAACVLRNWEREREMNGEGPWSEKLCTALCSWYPLFQNYSHKCWESRSKSA